MAITSGSDALRRVPLLASLDDTLLNSLAKELEDTEFLAGTRIFGEGDPGSALYLIRQGKVKVVRTDADRELILCVLDDGEYFGELSLLDGRPRSATVVAIESTSTYVLPREAFARFLERQTGAALHLLGVLTERLRHTSELLSEMASSDLPARLAKRLGALARDTGETVPAGLLIPRELTSEDIAPLVGGTAAQVDMELRALTEKGIVAWDAGKLLIRSPQLLEERTRGIQNYVGLGHVNVPRWLLEP